ncbi:enoyl-CoA hydratase/isomerase family protein [Patulibacter minatonensis]|uniref:enoyl-CoA hydratase/isomerase family protein n=1 Tax=Patulibacter minatonensis TaxID=298163 RepID=UPI0004796D8C|nr:enoyl-CoA hydratase-related protein [Patulibacter minatonensis]
MSTDAPTDVRYEVRAGVATVTIDRPDVMNAFRERTMLELIDAFDRADADPEVGVVVLTGAGDQAFSTGGDVAMEHAFDRHEGRRMARILIRLSEAVRGVGKPVIAKIRGWCVGGGNELNLCCDLAIAGASARFAHTDSRLGNSPIWYATQLLPLVVGERRAKEIVLLGEPCSATEAAAMGWINRVVPDAELDDAVAGWCERLLGNSPQAMRLSKVSLNFAGDALMPSVRHGFEALTQTYESPEFREGTTAFLERRPPRFR